MQLAYLILILIMLSFLSACSDNPSNQIIDCNLINAGYKSDIGLNMNYYRSLNLTSITFEDKGSIIIARIQNNSIEQYCIISSKT
jgi:hypothetical protein